VVLFFFLLDERVGLSKGGLCMVIDQIDWSIDFEAWFGYSPVSDVGCNQGDRNVIMTINKLKLRPILRSPGASTPKVSWSHLHGCSANKVMNRDTVQYP
jgi:hypothetical protein